MDRMTKKERAQEERSSARAKHNRQYVPLAKLEKRALRAARRVGASTIATAIVARYCLKADKAETIVAKIAGVVAASEYIAEHGSEL